MASVYVNTQWGCTALISAAASGHEDCVRLLTDAGADTDARNDVRGRVSPFFGCFRFSSFRVHIFALFMAPLCFDS